MRLCVIFPGALGDLCLLVPALVALTASGGRVELSVRRALAELVPVLLPDVVLGPPVDGAAMASLFAADGPAPAVRAWLAGADRVHAWLARADDDGRLTARLAEAARAPVHVHAVPRGDGERHVADEYAAALGVTSAPAVVVGPPPGGAPRGSGGRLLIHPGAGARAKRWTREGFVRVAERWAAAGGAPALWLGPAEEFEAEWWRARCHELLVDVPLADAPRCLARAALWLGNDSGMSQLAGVLGSSGVVLFGPTRPERWRPRGGALVPVVFAGRDDGDVVDELLAVLGAPAVA